MILNYSLLWVLLGLSIYPKIIDLFGISNYNGIVNLSEI